MALRSFGKNKITTTKKTETVSETPKVTVSTEKRKEQGRLQKKLLGQLSSIMPMDNIQDRLKEDPIALHAELKTSIYKLIDDIEDVVSAVEREEITSEMIDEITGLGPLESLIKRNDIDDIMVIGCNKVYIEVGGHMELTNITFRDEAQLINVCRRIVSAIGRRVDESSPICDARLADGSRVAIVAPPLSPKGTTLTIRKFKKEKFSLKDLVRFGSLSRPAAKVIEIMSACRCNILVSGGTGSGKTTLLNCITGYIAETERVITIEDAMELQLQQSHVVSWESRPANLEGKGEITIGDLLKAALRHRPERIIIGEVRGKEAFDMLQAMNTGHDGSAGTVHANSPREAFTRLESMIAMGGWGLPAMQVREQIANALDVIIQAERLRDGSRRVTRISEVLNLEGDRPLLQDVMVFEIEGEDENGKIIGKHKMTGLRPRMLEKARYYGRDDELLRAVSGIVEKGEF